MPVITSEYRASPMFRSGHLHSILPTLLRNVDHISYRRERISTPDGDFLDLDWSDHGSDRLMVISHGLEGHSHRQYVKGMAAHANRSGWDACAWNMRGCSGEINRKPILYHSGATYDLDTVLQYIRDGYSYEEILLVGFSLGGNLTIKYFGEQGELLAPEIVAGVTFSVPADLTSSSFKLARAVNAPYMKRFLHHLGEKMEAKSRMFPGLISVKGFSEIRDFKGFDDRYTAPLHGFRDAEDYWERASSKPFIPYITRPLLLVNAQDDPFLTPECYPVEEARQNPYFYLEMPKNGGHTGFIGDNLNSVYWSERRVFEFYRQDAGSKKNVKSFDSPEELFDDLNI